MLETLRKKLEPCHTAVLVVDMQNEFCEPEGLRGKEGDDLSGARALAVRLNPFLQTARTHGVKVVYLQAVYDSDGGEYISEVWQEQDHRRRRSGVITPQCPEGTWNAEIVSTVAPVKGDIVVQKHRYCGFQGTALDQILRSNGIRTVVMTGMATDICVETTARAAFVRDYYVVFSSDGTTTYSAEVQANTLRGVNRFYGEVASMGDITNCWSRQETR
jgi:ureidoacrylate peracid hydrolase